MSNTNEEEQQVKSIRLNATMRDEIIEKVMEQWDSNNPEPKDLVTEQQVAEYAYRKAVPSKLEKELKEVEKKYGFRQKQEEVRVIVNGEHEVFPFYPEGCDYSDRINFARHFKYTRGWNGNTVTLSSDDKIMDKWEKQKDQKAEHISSRNAMERQVESIIYSVNTTKQLVETWPEIREFVPMFIQNPSKGINLPATLKDELNASLGVK